MCAYAFVLFFSLYCVTITRRKNNDAHIFTKEINIIQNSQTRRSIGYETGLSRKKEKEQSNHVVHVPALNPREIKANLLFTFKQLDIEKEKKESYCSRYIGVISLVY